MIAITRNSITLSAVLLLPCTALYWLLTTPNVIGASTYLTLAVLALATAVIAFNTWRNAHPAGSLAQLIHETDGLPARVPVVAVVAPLRTRAPRWDRGAIPRIGRSRALLTLGAVATSGLLYAGLA